MLARLSTSSSTVTWPRTPFKTYWAVEKALESYAITMRRVLRSNSVRLILITIFLKSIITLIPQMCNSRTIWCKLRLMCKPIIRAISSISTIRRLMLRIGPVLSEPYFLAASTLPSTLTSLTSARERMIGRCHGRQGPTEIMSRLINSSHVTSLLDITLSPSRRSSKLVLIQWTWLEQMAVVNCN